MDKPKDYSHIRPSTIEGIKSLAKTIKKAKGITHTAALEEASKQAGYQNYTHARNTLTQGEQP